MYICASYDFYATFKTLKTSHVKDFGDLINSITDTIPPLTTIWVAKAQWHVLGSEGYTKKQGQKKGTEFCKMGNIFKPRLSKQHQGPSWGHQQHICQVQSQSDKQWNSCCNQTDFQTEIIQRFRCCTETLPLVPYLDTAS